MGIQNGEPTISMDSIDQNLSIARINSDNNVESLNNDEFSLQLEDRQLQRLNFNSKSGESYKIPWPTIIIIRIIIHTPKSHVRDKGH